MGGGTRHRRPRARRSDSLQPEFARWGERPTGKDYIRSAAESVSAIEEHATGEGRGGEAGPGPAEKETVWQLAAISDWLWLLAFGLSPEHANHTADQH